MQSLLTSDDNCHCKAVAHNNLEGFYFPYPDVLGYKRTGLYHVQAKISGSWVKLIDIFHKA